MNISSSKRLSDSDARSGLKTLPATLNKRSTGADDAGMARYLEAKIARFGHFFSCVCQNCRGSLVFSMGGWARYSSTSDSDDPATPVVMGSSASRKSNRSPPGAMGWSTRRRLAHGSCGVSRFKRTIFTFWYNESVMAACCVDLAQRSLKRASRTDAVM